MEARSSKHSRERRQSRIYELLAIFVGLTHERQTVVPWRIRIDYRYAVHTICIAAIPHHPHDAETTLEGGPQRGLPPVRAAWRN